MQNNIEEKEMNQQNNVNSILITYVDKEGPFLKIWGQTDKNVVNFIEQVLHNVTSQFDSGVCVPHINTLQTGVLCCVKYKDNKYYRARITNLSFMHNRYIEVVFVDFGNKDLVPVSNIRSLEGFNSAFISIPPQAHCFLLSEVVCSNGEWSDSAIEEISKEIRNTEVHFNIVAQVAKYYLIRLFVGNNDLTIPLIQRGLIRQTSFTTQEAVLLAMMPRTTPSSSVIVQTQSQQNIATYKAHILEPGGQYPVYVSYVTEGPCNFSVQLQQSEEMLGKLMKEINSMTLTPIEDLPIPGTVCLARCAEDEHICRAVVINEVDTNFKVFYVDFGNFEIVPLESLFEIPFKCVIPKVMAIRFALAGVEKSTVTLEMQCAFKQFVDNRLMHMKVMPNTTRTALPRCELWDPVSNINALDIVKQAASNVYPNVLQLNRGFCQIVKVSYVYSCNRFYVQLKNRQDDLNKLMINTQDICKRLDPIKLDKIKIGLPCYALFESDQQWYRCQITKIIDNSQVKVLYVDYGNEEIINVNIIKPIDKQQLTTIEPQAIECCLNGYQNFEPDQERDNLLEDLILEQEFTMKVVEMQNGKALVELINNLNYNVASLLLDKIATSRSQISPLLVQADNKIEHRKSYHGHTDSTWKQTGKSLKSPRNNNESNEQWRTKKNLNRSHRDSDESSDSSCFKNNRKYNKNENDKESWNKKTPPKKIQSNINDNWEDNTESKKYSPNNRNNTVAKNDDWGAESFQSPKDNFNKKKNDWNNDNKREQQPSRNRGFNKKDERHSQNNDINNWNSSSPTKSIKKSDFNFKRENSNVSSASSDKSQRNNKNKTTTNWSNNNQNQWNTSESSSSLTVPNPASNDDKFKIENVVGLKTNVIISWFHNPNSFFCQTLDKQNEFKKMMEDIQLAYKDRKSGQSFPVGAPVIGRFFEDNVLYRAQVIDVSKDNNYKIFFVDFGNVSTTKKIWPIEKRFMDLPMQAIHCSLNGIIPNGDNWASSENYAQYFDKPYFICEFIDVQNESALVNLQYEDKDIGMLLIENGLAVSSQYIPPVVEIPILIGQQFRAQLTSVNSLNDFTILIKNFNVLLICTINNSTNSNESYEDKLKENLNQIVIVYVEDVVEDDRLKVVLYDHKGMLLPLMDKNDDLYETVEIICPTLILNSYLNGVVTYVEENLIYIQPNDRFDAIETLLNNLFEHYNELKDDDNSIIIPIENEIYAVLSSDGNWYRGRIKNFDNEQATVNYIDYGNCESVKLSNLKELHSDFFEIEILCVEVNMLVPSEELLNQEITINLISAEIGWQGNLISSSLSINNPESIVALEEQPVLESQTINNEEQSFEIPQLEINNEQIENQEFEQESTKILVILSHIDSPSEFYVQLAEASTMIDELQVNLQEEAEKMENLESPTIGVLCAAPYSLDQQWYRAQVLDFDNDITTVRFIDYGNTDVLDNISTHIKTLPQNLLQLEAYARRCRLNIKPLDNEWSQAATQRFEELTNLDNLTAQFINKDGKTDYIELYSNGENIKDILIMENLAILDEKINNDNGLIGYVSHLNSPSEFWIQLENCIDELERIAEQLSTAETFPELNDFTPGTLCAALFPDDEMWYRGRILSNTVAGREVLFIDYGNSCNTCSLRELPEDLLMLQPLAQKCSLVKPNNLQQWTTDMCEKFNELSNEGRTTFKIHKISIGETALVELFVDEQNVTTILLNSDISKSKINKEQQQKHIQEQEEIIKEQNGQIENELEIKHLTNGNVNEEEEHEKIEDNIEKQDDPENSEKDQDENQHSPNTLIDSELEEEHEKRIKSDEKEDEFEKELSSPDSTVVEQDQKHEKEDCLENKEDEESPENKEKQENTEHDTSEEQQNPQEQVIHKNIEEKEQVLKEDDKKEVVPEKEMITEESNIVKNEGEPIENIVEAIVTEKTELSENEFQKDIPNNEELDKVNENKSSLIENVKNESEIEEKSTVNDSGTDSRSSSRLSGEISHNDPITSKVLVNPDQ